MWKLLLNTDCDTRPASLWRFFWMVYKRLSFVWFKVKFSKEVSHTQSVSQKSVFLQCTLVEYSTCLNISFLFNDSLLFLLGHIKYIKNNITHQIESFKDNKFFFSNKICSSVCIDFVESKQLWTTFIFLQVCLWQFDCQSSNLKRKSTTK